MNASLLKILPSLCVISTLAACGGSDISSTSTSSDSSYISFGGSANGEVVLDANGASVRFYKQTGQMVPQDGGTYTDVNVTSANVLIKNQTTIGKIILVPSASGAQVAETVSTDGKTGLVLAYDTVGNSSLKGSSIPVNTGASSNPSTIGNNNSSTGTGTTSSTTNTSFQNAISCITSKYYKATDVESDKIIYTNNCSKPIFMAWCGDQKYTSKTCGQTSNYYTSSTNMATSGISQSNTVYLSKPTGVIEWIACYERWLGRFEQVYRFSKWLLCPFKFTLCHTFYRF